MTNFQIEEFTIDIPNGNLHVKRWIPQNCDKQIPIVLLHDSLGSVDQWRDFPEQLAVKLSRPVIAYDRLGFGRSSERYDLPSTVFIEEESEIYFPYLKASLSLTKYTLLGHSVGGAMAINIAANDADCDGVITISAQAFIEELTLEGIRQAKVAFSNPDQQKRLERWHKQKAAWVLSAWIDRWLSHDFRDWNLGGTIEKVHCPILAIHGDQDEYGSTAFPEFIVNKASGLAEINIIRDCGHIPHKEKTEDVLESVSQFFKAHLRD